MQFTFRLAVLIGSLIYPAVGLGDALVICHVGGPGNTLQAKPVLQKFISHLEGAGGFQRGSLEGEYHTTQEGCLGYIKKQRPILGVFDFATYLQQQKNLQLQPIACMGKIDMVRYHLLVRQGTHKNFKDLNGLTLVVSQLEDLPFLSRIVFDGRLVADKHFKLSFDRLPLKVIRKVARSQADAALVDELTFNHLSELDLPVKLQSIYTSPYLPGLTLTVIGKGNGKVAQLVKKVNQALPQLCSGEGKNLCQNFQITTFTKISPDFYNKTIKKYHQRPKN